MKKRVILCISQVLLLAAWAADDLDFGSKSDLWDVSQGITITALSGQANQSFRPENMFGAAFPTTDGLPSFTFEDGRPAGYVHFVEWRTPAPVTLTSIHLHAQGDGPSTGNQREFARVRILAKGPASTAYDTILLDYSPSHPYNFEDLAVRLLVSSNFPAVTAREFRAEFVSSGETYFSGPRVWEMDAFAPSVDLDFGSKSDLWDASQGITITAISGRANPSFRPENMFGTAFPTTDGLPSFTFEDGLPAGYVHFVEWNTPAPVSLSSIHLHAQGDGPNNANQREFARVRILAKAQSSTSYDTVLLDYSPSHPYNFEDYDVRLLVSRNFPAVTAKEFRAEFVSYGDSPYSGPRVWEMDAFASSVDLDFGSKDDLWDSHRGARVTAISGRASADYKPENIFGATYPNPDGLPSFTFEDNQPAGFVHYVEWTTPEPVTVKSFHLRAQGDGPQYQNGREFTRFRLLAKSPGSATFDSLLYDYTPSHPYTFEDYDSRLTVSDNLPAVVAREFRAEFVDSGVRYWSAPRIWELDGFAGANQSAVDIYPAIELEWATVAGRKYQLEVKEGMDGTWVPHGASFVGTGAKMNSIVSGRGKETQFFRLIQVN